MDVAKLGWIGWLLTALTWIVAYQLNSRSIRLGEINKSIDAFNADVAEFEDMALDHWISEDTKVQEYQLNLRVKRISNIAQWLGKITDQEYPSKEILNLRKSGTLYDQSTNKPQPSSSPKAKSIMQSSMKLQTYFKKKI